MADAKAPSPLPIMVPPGVRIISPRQSQIKGVLLSSVLALNVGVLVFEGAWYLSPSFDFFFYVSEGLGIAAGLLSGLGFFFGGQALIDINERAIRQFLGDPTMDLYDNGKQWLAPWFEDAVVTPGPAQDFALEIKTDEPEAKDIIEVVIGAKRKAVVQYR